jgi:hypothetical protein
MPATWIVYCGKSCYGWKGKNDDCIDQSIINWVYIYIYILCVCVTTTAKMVNRCLGPKDAPLGEAFLALYAAYWIMPILLLIYKLI